MQEAVYQLFLFLGSLIKYAISFLMRRHDEKCRKATKATCLSTWTHGAWEMMLVSRQHLPCRCAIFQLCPSALFYHRVCYLVTEVFSAWANHFGFMQLYISHTIFVEKFNRTVEKSRERSYSVPVKIQGTCI